MEIQKSTYVEADDKTTKGMTYDLLSGIHEKVDQLNVCYREHLGVCERRFKKLENQKKVNAAMSAGGGVVGGILVWIGALFTGGKS